MIRQATYDVHGGVRGNVAHAGEDQRHRDLANEGDSREDTSKTIDEEGSSETDKPEPLKVFVDGITREEMLRSNSAPNNTSVVEGLDVGAGESACCLGGTDILDGTHSPLNGGKLTQT